MGRHSKKRTLDVRMNGEFVGQWTLAAQEQHEFRYDESWLATPHARPLSLSLPLSTSPHRGASVESYFDNLLPESQSIRQRAQSRFAAASTKAFDLLTEIGRDCVGAVQLLKPEEVPPGVRQIQADPLTSADLADLLRANIQGSVLGRRHREDFRISIAGGQEKIALLQHEGRWHTPRGTTPTTHILKQPLGKVGMSQADLSTSIENEWLCAQVVGAFALEIASCEMAQFEDQRVLIVERFDRRLAPDGSWWIRLPQEDLCQATKTPFANKYESDGGPGIQTIMTLLLGSLVGPADRRRFFEAQILFWMMGAIDGHAKNFSIAIEPKGRFCLTPLYDVISAYPVVGAGPNKLSTQDLRMAMAVVGKNRHYRWDQILRRHWQNTAQLCGLGAEIESLITSLVTRTPTVISKVNGCIPKDFPAELSDSILGGIEAAAQRLAAG